jgi:hypothetical protein
MFYDQTSGLVRCECLQFPTVIHSATTRPIGRYVTRGDELILLGRWWWCSDYCSVSPPIPQLQAKMKCK